MAKTVDSFSTIEDLRLKHNEVALDVGDISGLNTTRRSNLTEAVNSINEREFFFQEFVYTGTTNQVTFEGADTQQNTLTFRKDRIQVFVRGEHLFEGVDYEVINQNSDGSFRTISFNVSGSPYNSGGAKAVQAGDKVVIYAFTGSFLGVALQSTGSTFWILDDSNAIFNNNASGVILNGDNSSLTTDIESGFTLQLAGRTFAEDDIIATAAGKKFQAPIISDGTASLSSGSLTSAVNGTFSGTVSAEQLTTTDDLTVGDGAAINGDLAVLGNAALFGSANQIGNSSSDVLEIQGDLNMTSAVITSNFLPKVNDNVTLGSSTKKWSHVHSTAFTGNLTGDVTGNLSGNVTGDITGDVKASNGTTVLDSGTGSNATFTGSVTGNITGDVLSPNGSTVLDSGTGAGTDSTFIGNSASATKLQNARTISGVSFDGTGNITLDTSHIDENGREYFTNTRADARADVRIGASGIGALSNVSATANSLASSGTDVGKILAWSGSEFAPVSPATTDTITEGGTNLFYTNERVLDFLSGTAESGKGLIGGTGITLSYNDSADTLTITGVAQYGNSDVQSYLSGGAGLTLSNSGSFSVNTSNGIKIDGDDVELDYEVISSSSLGGSAPNGTGDPIGHLYFVI